MKQHLYRVTVEHLADANGVPPATSGALRFEVGNHDDIPAIVARLRGRDDLPFDAEQAAAFAVGLKLFSEVMLEHRGHPLFADFAPYFGQFMKTLKKGSQTARE